MKLKFKFSQLQLAALSAGLLGFLLRSVLYTTALDEQGLLVAGHWTQPLLLALSVLVIVLFALGCLLLPKPANTPGRLQSLAAGFGCFVGAAGFLSVAIFKDFSAPGIFNLSSGVFSIAAAASLVFIGIHRCIGRAPHFAAHLLVCLAMGIRMISQYRLWSSAPQIADYCFLILALVTLMLSAYHAASIDAGVSGWRLSRFYGLMAVFFSMVSAYGASDPLIPLCGLWALTNLPFFRHSGST